MPGRAQRHGGRGDTLQRQGRAHQPHHEKSDVPQHGDQSIKGWISAG
jgi:hypothetical protein